LRPIPAFGLLFLLLALNGCQQAGKQKIFPIPDFAVAVASFSQPTSTTELLAGTLPENHQPVSLANLDRLNNLLYSQLEAETRAFLLLPPQDYLKPLRVDGRGKRSSLATWTWHARQAETPVILVPQILQWQNGQRVSVILDFFLIDARYDGQLLQRLRFEYLDWTELPNLVQADIEQAIRAFGL